MDGMLFFWGVECGVVYAPVSRFVSRVLLLLRKMGRAFV